MIYYEQGKFHAKLMRDSLYSQKQNKRKNLKWFLHSLFDLYIENSKSYNRERNDKMLLYYQGFLDEMQKEIQQYINNI